MPAKRILCVDDQDDMCSLIATILSDHEVVSATAKQKYYARQPAGQFDLYLLDYYLPHGTGLEVCLLIRDFDDSTPILFVTDFTELTRQQIENVNAQGIVWKQDWPDGLIATISKIFRPLAYLNFKVKTEANFRAFLRNSRQWNRSISSSVRGHVLTLQTYEPVPHLQVCWLTRRLAPNNLTCCWGLPTP